MKTTGPATGRISAAKTALILILLAAVWLAFVAMPARKQVSAKIPAPENALALKLRAVGLPDNSDLGGLPEIFAIWSANAEWKDGRTRFAYWHPVMKTYSYYFEATRSDRGIRFKEIPEPHDPAYQWDESLPDDCPIRFYTSRSERLPNSEPVPPSIPPPPVANLGKVEIDIPAPKIVPPPK